jgi:lysyl-tRNA synthetase class 2
LWWEARAVRAGSVVAMPFVESSAIARVDYDDAAQMLRVRFMSGRRYRYADVPREVYERFVAAPSKGQFFNAEIRDRYDYTEVT